MTPRNPAPLKLGLMAVSGAMLAGFFALVSSGRETDAESAAAQPPPDYIEFFAPNRPADAERPPPLESKPPHTRSRAS